MCQMNTKLISRNQILVLLIFFKKHTHTTKTYFKIVSHFYLGNQMINDYYSKFNILINDVTFPHLSFLPLSSTHLSVLNNLLSSHYLPK